MRYVLSVLLALMAYVTLLPAGVLLWLSERLAPRKRPSPGGPMTENQYVSAAFSLRAQATLDPQGRSRWRASA